MRRLDTTDCEAWRSARCPGSQADFDLAAARSLGAVIDSASTESTTASGLVYVARALLHCARVEVGATLVWLREWGVWSSSEHLPLYAVLIGTDSATYHTVGQAPGHFFDASEQDHAISLLFLCLAFGWGFSVFREGSALVVHCDHDGIVWLTGGTSAQGKALAAAVFDER